MANEHLVTEVLGGAIWTLSALGFVLLATRAVATLFSAANERSSSKATSLGEMVCWTLVVASFTATATVLAFALLLDQAAWQWFLAALVLNQILLLSWFASGVSRNSARQANKR